MSACWPSVVTSIWRVGRTENFLRSGSEGGASGVDWGDTNFFFPVLRSSLAFRMVLFQFHFVMAGNACHIGVFGWLSAIVNS